MLVADWSHNGGWSHQLHFDRLSGFLPATMFPILPAHATPKTLIADYSVHHSKAGKALHRNTSSSRGRE